MPFCLGIVASARAANHEPHVKVKSTSKSFMLTLGEIVAGRV